MYARSITYTYLKRKGMGLCSKKGTISPQWRDRHPNSFMSAQVLPRAVKQCVTVTADIDRTETSDGFMPSSYGTKLSSSWYGYTTSLAKSDKRHSLACVTSHILQNSVNLQRCLERITNEIIVALYIWLHCGCQKFVCYFPSKWVPKVCFPNKKKSVCIWYAAILYNN